MLIVLWGAYYLLKEADFSMGLTTITVPSKTTVISNTKQQKPYSEPKGDQYKP